MIYFFIEFFSCLFIFKNSFKESAKLENGGLRFRFDERETPLQEIAASLPSCFVRFVENSRRSVGVLQTRSEKLARLSERRRGEGRALPSKAGKEKRGAFQRKRKRTSRRQESLSGDKKTLAEEKSTASVFV
jgi:hypothetical protein